jgi:hypothetical protein
MAELEICFATKNEGCTLQIDMAGKQHIIPKDTCQEIGEIPPTHTAAIRVNCGGAWVCNGGGVFVGEGSKIVLKDFQSGCSEGHLTPKQDSPTKFTFTYEA